VCENQIVKLYTVNLYLFMYLLICSSFNGAFNNTDYSAFNNWMTVNNELEKLCKGTNIASVEVLFRHLAGRSGKTPEKPLSRWLV
jgi:hypothetical protein